MRKIFVAGHNGMVGSAICRKLSEQNEVEIITCTRLECDLTNQKSVSDFFFSKKIDEVYLAAAKVGGIHANNTYPAEFIYENLMIQANIIHSAFQSGVKKLLFLGSSCIYPKLAKQPMAEDALLTGQLEETNEPYAIAKIAGIKLCESYNRQHGSDFRSVMPTNLYGQGDNFHPENSHVIPAMMQRFHQAVQNDDKQVVIWGTGKPMREFLHVDDMASACVYVMKLSKDQYDKNVQPMLTHINVGTGVDCTIEELAQTMAKVVGFDGELVFDTSKPDGTPRKLLDVNRLKKLGWQSTITLEQGLKKTYSWFLENYTDIRS